MNDTAARITSSLRKRGLRITPQRMIVLEAVLEGGGHFDAEDVYDQLRTKEISRATVYRTLPLLVDCGVVERAFLHDGKQCYEFSDGVVHHDHLLCTECGRAIEFRDDRIEEIQDAVCRRKKFRPRDHRLVVRGICSNCARKSSPGRSARATRRTQP